MLAIILITKSLLRNFLLPRVSFPPVMPTNAWGPRTSATCLSELDIMLPAGAKGFLRPSLNSCNVKIFLFNCFH